MREGRLLDAEVILRTLNDHNVRYVVVGALGATLQGSPLRTDDIDICPQPERGNLARLAEALAELNAQEWDPHKGEAVARQWTAQMLQVDHIWILVTDHGDLDLVFKPGGTDGYRDLARGAVTVEIDDLQIQVASLADIIRSKEAVGREKDLAQLPTLRRLLSRLEQGD